MGDLAILQKYPDSYRLDHPDAQDIYETTYAKGTIQEVEKLEDYPIKMKARAQVKLEDGTKTDFLPIFFHPKPQYWDDEDGKATDFNQGGKYFEKAWMSFRGGDEVRVMLRQGKPYAIVGFYDNVPRIGEDIFKVLWDRTKYQAYGEQTTTYPDGVAYTLTTLDGEQIPDGGHFCYLQASHRDYYGGIDAEQEGPDGLPLELLEEVQPFNNTTEIADSSSTSEDYITEPDPDNPNEHKTRYQSQGTSSDVATLKEWLLPLGSILYSFHLLAVESTVQSEQNMWWWLEMGSPPEYVPVLISTTKINEYYKYYDYMIQAAPYSDELYNKLKGMRKSAAEAFEQWNTQKHNWSSIDDGSLKVQQGNDEGPLPAGFRDNWKQEDFFKPDDNNGPYGIDPETFKIFIRPHTKAGLQAAGMWPGK